MKTAQQVLKAIDGRITQMEQEVVGPCVDALLDWGDREAYREAMQRATSLRAVKRLRSDLATEFEGESAAPAKAGRKAR